MKRKILAIVVAAVWAGSFYAWGRHDGVSKGEMSMKMPFTVTVVMNDKKDEAKPEEKKSEEINYVQISDRMCGTESAPAPAPKTEGAPKQY
jgi:hypothetical protein